MLSDIAQANAATPGWSVMSVSGSVVVGGLFVAFVAFVALVVKVAEV